MPENLVFDSSAALAVLLREPGGAHVQDLLEGALLSTVNLAEIQTRLLVGGLSAELAWERVIGLHLEFCPFTKDQARIAAELVAVTKRYGLSLGDRACLALAMERQATVYTTDRAWKELDLGIQVEVIR